MPPSPIILIISYWLMRTPGCGIAEPAWTPVVPSVLLPLLVSNASQALWLGLEPACEPPTEARRARGLPWRVGEAGVAPGAGDGPALPSIIVESPALAVDSGGGTTACEPGGGVPSALLSWRRPVGGRGEPEGLCDRGWIPDSVFDRAGALACCPLGC